eukprot:gene8822-6353_t
MQRLLALLQLLMAAVVVVARYCPDFMVTNVTLRSAEGHDVGVLTLRLSQVDAVLTHGLQVTGSSIDPAMETTIARHIQERLERLQLINRQYVEPAITAHDAVRRLQQSAAASLSDHTQQELFLTSRRLNRLPRALFAKSNRVSVPVAVNAGDEVGVDVDVNDDDRSASLPKELLTANTQRRSVIRVYQTINAFTGGTTAMRTLATDLQHLGFPVVLCNDTNIDDTRCNAPHDRDVVITGEWCEPVLREYLHYPPPQQPPSPSPSPSPPLHPATDATTEHRQFHGRGIQYFLGFHHGRDECRGWITAADSHFIYTTLVHRGLHAYYLGCVMAETVSAHALHLHTAAAAAADASSACPSLRLLRKERLILLDADYFDDYPPAQPFAFQVPDGYQVVVLRGFSSDDVAMLLQRAQIVVDLAMPGPERISSEAILFGAIPIVAERWNGASDVDFPGLLRVDALNGSDITAKLRFVVDHYEELLSQATAAVFQTIALLYLFPLASVDLVVADAPWFYRHHYVFLDYLRQAGYLAVDPMDPREWHLRTTSTATAETSFVRIRSAPEVTPSPPPRLWEVFTVTLPVGYLWRTPVELYRCLRQHLPQRTSRVLLRVPTRPASPPHAHGTLVVRLYGPDGRADDDDAAATAPPPMAEVDDVDGVALWNVCDLLRDDNHDGRSGGDGEGDGATLVTGVRETLVWQMLVTTYQTQLRDVMHCRSPSSSS